MKKIIIISQVRNEDGIIESFCRYNLSYSDGLLIQDNHSSDNTKEIIQKLINEGLPIHWINDVRGKNNIARKAIGEYEAELIIPLDADEFLYHTDGINPREILESLREDVEYHVLWRTYVYEKEPDIKLGFMPNNFSNYRNPVIENIHGYSGKSFITRYLMQEKKAKFGTTAHYLMYHKENKGTINIDNPEKLVCARFPIRSKNQIIRKLQEKENLINEGSMNVSFCEDKIKLSYTDYNKSDKSITIDEHNDPITRQPELTLQCCTLFINTGNGYSENEKIMHYYKDNEIEISCQIPANAINIRLDPIENHGCVLCNIEILSFNGIVDYEPINGYKNENGDLVFVSADPQIELYGAAYWINIKYRITQFTDFSYYKVFENFINITYEKKRLEAEYDYLAEEQSELVIVQKKLVAERDGLAAERDGLAVERNRLAAERDGLAAEQDRLVAERDGLAAERDGLAVERNRLAAERDGLAAEQDRLVAEQDRLVAEQDRLAAERDGLVAEQDRLIAERDGLLNSRSWRFSKPLRYVANFMRRHRVLRLFAKGLLSLKRHGIIKTVRKVLKLNKSKTILCDEKSIFQNQIISDNISQNGLIAELDGLAAERDGLAAERVGLVAERNVLAAERDGLAVERNNLVAERDGLVAECNGLVTERGRLAAECNSLLVEQDVVVEEKVKFSIVVPLYNTPSLYLHQLIDSVRSQTYTNWELCFADGSTNSSVKIICNKYMQKDSRIIYKKLKENLGIAGNSNEAIKMATGDYLVFCDHDDIISLNALYENAVAIKETNADVIYSDEDHIDHVGINHFFPFYKPDWSRDLLYSHMYISHLLVVKRYMLDKVGFLNSEFDGSQDYDLMLRLSENTEFIYHIPKILYSWRETQSSTSINPFTKTYAQKAGLNALNSHLLRRYNGIAHAHASSSIYAWDTRFDTMQNIPLVSIIIPMRDKSELTNNCVQSIINNSTYVNWEIIIVNNLSADQETIDWLHEITKCDRRISVIEANYNFNWSKINNSGLQYAKGEVFIFLNNDTVIISPDWIERLCENALRDDIGVVGSLLLYEDGTIQHAGVVVGINGWADFIFKGKAPIHFCSPYVSPKVSRNVLAVTGACMCISKKTIEKIGVFDENFIFFGNDVEYCIRAYNNGLNNLYNANVQIQHLESKSMDSYIPEIDFKMSYEVYTPYRENIDPYFNPNLDINSIIPTVAGKINDKFQPYKNYFDRNKLS